MESSPSSQTGRPGPYRPAGSTGSIRLSRPGDGSAIADLLATIAWDEDLGTQARRKAERVAFIDADPPLRGVPGREHILPRYHVMDITGGGIVGAVETAPPLQWIGERPVLSEAGRMALAASVIEVHAVAVAEEHRGHGMGRMLLDVALNSAVKRGFRLAMAIAHAEEEGFYTAAGFSVVTNTSMVAVAVAPGAAGLAWRPLDPADSRLRLAYKPLDTQVLERRVQLSAEGPVPVVLLAGVVKESPTHIDAQEAARLSSEMGRAGR